MFRQTRGAGARDPDAGGAGARGTGVGGTGAGGTRAVDPGAGGAGAGGAGAGGPGAGGTVQRCPFFVPPPPLSLPPHDSVLLQVLSLLSSIGLPPSLLSPLPHHLQPQLQPDSPLPAPSPYTELASSSTERREPESRLAWPVRAVCTGRRVPRPRPPPVPGNHVMALRPSFVPLQVPRPPPPASSLPGVPEPESDLACAASPTVPRLLATVVTDPLFESTATSALVAELVDFAAACRLDYAASLVAESESDRPPSEGWQTAMDTEMASWKSTGTYVDAVPPSRANIVNGIWIFRVKRPPGSPPAFKARYVARGFSQRQGVDFFHAFSPTPKMTTLWVLLHVAAQRDYELHSLDFSTTFLQGSLHEEIWLRRPLGFTESFLAGTLWSLRRPVYGLRQAPREWHNTLRMTLAALGFAPSTADPSLFLRTDTSLPPFYVLVYVDDLVFATTDTEALALVKLELQKRHTCTDLAPPSDESVELSGPYQELVGCLMYLMTCTRPDLAYPLSIMARYVAPVKHRPEHWEAAKRVLRYLCSTSGMRLVLAGRGLVVLTGHADASWVDELATQRSSQGYTFSLGPGSVSWRSTRLSSVLGSNCEVEIYAGAMAPQELCWLTYLLTDLGERPRSSPVLYVDSKAMIALFQEHRLKHRTKHIALHYFLARELQQCGQLHLSYVATRANAADIFTKALYPRVALCCSPRHALLQPAHRALLPCASRPAAASALHPAAASTSHPTAASASRPAALLVEPCCSQCVALCCPACRSLLQPARRALLQLARHAVLPCASHPAAASASRPTAARALCSAAPRVAPCCPAQRAPCCPVHRTPCLAARGAPCLAARGAPCQTEPRRPARAALPNLSRATLPRSPAPPSCPAATIVATAARATGAASGGATESAEVLLVLGVLEVQLGVLEVLLVLERRSLPLLDDPTPQQLCECVLQRACPGGGGFGFLRTVQRRQQSQQETFSPQVLSELFPQRCVTGSVEAAARGVNESATALGASESAVALGTSESAVALGARASPATGPSSAEALHTFTLDSGVSRCFFRDFTTLTPLAAPVPVSLVDPTGGPVVARASTVLPCPAVPSDSLSGLHLPTFPTNLVRNAAIQDVWVDTFIPGGQRVVICEVAASSQVSAPGQLAASCSCRVLSHQTLLWHHLLGHPSLPHLRSMHFHLLVSGLPRSLPSLPRSPAPPCLLCVEGRQRAAPHSSEFPPTTAPLQTLHMEVWGLGPVGGTGQERYFLLVVDDYTRYTTVFPLQCKAVINSVLIPLIRATRRQLRERFSRDFPVLRLHSDRGGEFSSDLLAEFCQDEGIHQSFTLPTSLQQNGIAERRIGLIMEVARTSMIHAAAPHFLWPFVVRYAAHQLNLWPRVSEPETSPTLRWTGKVGDASVFQVRGALSLVRDAKASKLSSRTPHCVFLGFPTDAPPWQFYHPHKRRVFSSQDVTFDESVCFYRLHRHASHPGPASSDVSHVDPPPLVEPLEISSDSSGSAKGGDLAADDTAATHRSPRLETPPGFLSRLSSLPPQPAVVESGAETAGAEPGGGEIEGEGSGGAATGGAGCGGAATGAVGDLAGGPGAGKPPQPDLLEKLSPQAIRAWIVRRGNPGGGGYSPAGAGAASPRGSAGAGGAGGAAGAGGTRGATGAGGAGPTSPGGTAGAGGAGGAASAGGARAGGTRGAGAAGPRGAHTGGAGAAEAVTYLSTDSLSLSDLRPLYLVSHPSLPRVLTLRRSRGDGAPCSVPGDLQTKIAMQLTQVSAGGEPGGRFTLKIHMPSTMFVPRGGTSSTLVPVDFQEAISASMAVCHARKTLKLKLSVLKYVTAKGSSTTLPCPAVPSGFLTGLYIPSFSRNLVGVGYLQYSGITVTFPAHGRTAICTDASTGALLATFTREPLSGLFVLHTMSSQVAESSQVIASPQVAESGQVTASPPVVVFSQVAASGQVAASCSCRLVLGLPRVFPLLPSSLAPPCTPCVAGRLRATPHSSLRPATAPFQTLHLEVWGPAPSLGPKRELYFLVVVDDYSWYTMVFPLAKKSEVTFTLIRWLLATEGTRGSRVRCLHSVRGESPQQSGVAEHRIGLVMDIARTSMIHARAPHFLWPYALRYAAHKLNLQPRVSWPEVSPTSLWTGSLGVGSAFNVWGCLALVRDTSADKLSARAILYVFLGFLVGSPDYSFYHPPLHQFLDSHDVRFDESVSYYTRYPCRGLPVPPPPFFLAPSLPPFSRSSASPSPQSSSQSPQQPSALPRQVTVDSIGVGAGGAATGGTWSGGARSRGAGARGSGTRHASSGSAGAGGAGVGGASSGGAGAGGAGAGGASSRGAGAGGAGAAGACFGGAGVGGAGTVGAITEEKGAGGTLATPPQRYNTRFQALCSLERKEKEQVEQERQELQQLDQQQQHQQQQTPQPPLLQQLFPPMSGLRALGLPSSPPSRSSPPSVPHDWTCCCPPRARPSSPPADLRTVLFRSPPRRSPLMSVLPSPPESSLTVSSHPITYYYHAARPVVSRVLASLVTEPRASSSSVSALTAAVADFASTHRLDYATRVVAAPPPCLLSIGGEFALGCDVLEDKKFELEFLAAASPSLYAMLLSLEGDPDALDIPTPRTYREAVSGKWASQWKAAMDSGLASWRSTGTYIDAVPPPMMNVVDSMWLFKVKRPPGSPPMFKSRYVARGFIQREGVDFFHTFALTPKMTTLWVLLHVAAQRDYKLHSFDFSIAPRRPVYGLRQSPRDWHDTLRSTLRDLGFCPSSADPSLFVRTGSTPFFILVYVDDLVFATANRAALAEVKSKLQKRYTCTDLGELQRYLGLQITRDRAARTITLTQSHMVQQVLRRFGFQFSTTQPTPLVVDHRLTDPFPDEPFESSGPYAKFLGCLMVAKYLATTSGLGLVLGGMQPVVLTGHCDSSYADDVETQRSTQGAEAEIYAGAMAAHELRWLTFLLADLGERPRSAPTLYADNKVIILLCREPRLESSVKHIDVRYFLLRELQ
ncbi:unnamed protein product [Closterium sp. NIES-53]